MARKMKLISESGYSQLSLRNPYLAISRDEKVFHEKNDHAAHVLELENIPDDIKLAVYNKLVHKIHNKLITFKEKEIPQVDINQDMKETAKSEDGTY